MRTTYDTVASHDNVTRREPEKTMTTLASLTLEDFQPRLNQTFQLHAGEQTVPMILTEVSEIQRARGPKGARAPFHLIFQGPAELQILQGSYRFTAEPGFDCDIFIVPIAKEETGFIYQAIFN